MWETVLVLALLAAPDPVRLGTVALVISRPRPLLNLLTFWLGCLAIAIAAALAMLFLLRDFTQSFMRVAVSATTNSTAAYIQIAIGVLSLPIAALIVVGISARQRARVPEPVGDRSALVLQPPTPTAFSRLLGRAKDTLDGESLWVAFVAGIASATPWQYLLALTAIPGAGAAAGTQLIAAVMFIFVMLAVVEIPLVSYPVAPAKTQAFVLQLHDWLRVRRRPVLAFIVASTGLFLVWTGVSNL
jgi:hypothetical protein